VFQHLKAKSACRALVDLRPAMPRYWTDIGVNTASGPEIRKRSAEE
jgi:hypothetical protein